MAELAKTAAARWEEEQHPGWTPAGVNSEPLLADLQRIQVSTACSISLFLALHLPSLCWHRLMLVVLRAVRVGCCRLLMLTALIQIISGIVCALFVTLAADLTLN